MRLTLRSVLIAEYQHLLLIFFSCHYLDYVDYGICKYLVEPNEIEGVCSSGSQLLLPTPRFYLDTYVYLYACVAILFYHIADAADGKHARNTQQSTPLLWSIILIHSC